MDYIIDFSLLTFIYMMFFYRKWRKVSKKSLFVKTIMYFYMAMVLYLTVMPFTMPFSATNNLFMETANFIPFRDLRLKYGGATREIILNIVMMVPFGLMFPIVKKKGLVKTVMTTFFFSLIIECFQLLSVWWGSVETRIFDVTDLITNTLGGFTGYLLFVVLLWVSLIFQKILKVIDS